MHTPAPWKLQQESADPNWHIVTNENGRVVIANVHIDPTNPSESANARLITAAPDLLASAKAICARCRAGVTMPSDYIRLEAIIAAVEGR